MKDRRKVRRKLEMQEGENVIRKDRSMQDGKKESRKERKNVGKTVGK